MNASAQLSLVKTDSPPKKVIFADFAVMKFNTVVQWLKRDAMEAEAVTDPPRFLARIGEEFFDGCVINLLLGGIGPFELVSNIRQKSRNPDIKIIVVSRQVHKLNIQNTMRAGAHDFVGEPFENENVYHRILYHMAPKKVIDPTGYETSVAGTESWGYLNLLLEASELLSRTERYAEHAAFLSILKKLAEMLGSNRTSLIIVEKESNTGVVLATSDDPNFHDFPISLQKYPEILHVLNAGNFVLIDDVSQNVLTQNINEKVRTISIGSLMVFPVRFQGEVMGVLNIRRAKATGLPSMDVMRVVQAIANTMAAHSNIKALIRKIYKEFKPARS
jgi:CheY-like chemotaxis protein